jgi:ParB-like chromosome segregation protein Spo0J
MTAPYQLLDPLSDEAYEALKADIAESGMVYPVVLDEVGAVIDGHHRKRIAEELGIEYPATVLPGLTEEEKIDRSLALNLTGRKQTREEKRETIRRYLLRRPNVSVNHAAQVTGSARSVVDAVRSALIAETAISPGDRVEETGRKARGRKPQQPDPEAVAARLAELAKNRAVAEKQQAKRAAKRAEAEAQTRASMAPGATTSSGRTAPRVIATQDRVKAAMNDCVLALTRALQDPGLDVELIRAEETLPKDFRISAVRLRLRGLVDEFGRRLTELERATKTSRIERDSADRP